MYPQLQRSVSVHSTPAEKRVRFNKHVKQYFIFTDVSRSPSPGANPNDADEWESNSPSSSDGLTTPPPYGTGYSPRIWEDRDTTNRSPYNIYAPAPSPIIPPSPNKSPVHTHSMSPSMLLVQQTQWNVHLPRALTKYDGDCATLSPGVRRIILRSERLLHDIVVAPEPGRQYITVGRVFDLIRMTLQAHISVNSLTFSDLSRPMKNAIWEVARRRGARSGYTPVDRVQHVDFLLNEHVVLGIFAEPGSEYWHVQFGRLALPHPQALSSVSSTK